VRWGAPRFLESVIIKAATGEKLSCSLSNREEKILPTNLLHDSRYKPQCGLRLGFYKGLKQFPELFGFQTQFAELWIIY